ncbi:chloride channel protein [Pseudoroseomonas ludipueritiae]|uniref:Chloride channel protein n=1 Tax=Pseudoroseomonas ludipueritiae TaxID=198093 RepID=A0ABR7R8X9_9PROT|nr:chloride channel protein [Pseudoroseomonas ludipueritiae]MBC9178158.1 chloride channel protein [Pseudoroseomonas ludipueritiae]MCG7361702.1 chloride channel protein [Roseomonas sp. ACRSG]
MPRSKFLHLSHLHPRRGAAALRGWVRQTEVGLILLAVVVGAVSGLLAVAIGAVARAAHVLFFGPEATHGLSALRGASPWALLLLPALGGLVLGGLNRLLARYHPRSPVDPIEANALHGGRLSLNDGFVVVAQNLVSNGFGASVGLEAGYTQIAGGAASRLGRLFGLRRGDLRVLVGCGAAGAIAAAFDAPLTGTFYAFELVVGVYSIVTLAPVVTSAVVAVLIARLVHGENVVLAVGGGVAPDVDGYGLALLLGLICGLAGIALMRGVTLTEQWLRQGIPWPNLRPAVGGLVVGALALITPGVLSAGHGSLHKLFLTETTLSSVALLLVLKAVASAVSIGAGFRGGLFFASLLMGALLGQCFAAILAILMPPGVDAVFLITVGTSAFGAAVIGAPLAMTFLALEMTGNFGLTGAVLVAVIASSVTVRRLFGYSFATWRFHLRGETIRSARDIGWLRDLTVGKLMRRDVRTVKADTRLSSFRRDFPLGAESRVVVVDEADRYAGIVLVADAHAETSDTLETITPLLQNPKTPLLPAMNAKEAMAVFDATESEALAVVDSADHCNVIGLLTQAHLLRRYGEELEKRRSEELGGA